MRQELRLLCSQLALNSKTLLIRHCPFKCAATWARYQQYPCRVNVSLAGLSNPHLQVLSEPLLQSSDDLLSPLKADFLWRKKKETPASPSLSALSFLNCHLSFPPFTLNQRMFCFWPRWRKRRRCASLNEASHWLSQLIVSCTLSSPSS